MEHFIDQLAEQGLLGVLLSLALLVIWFLYRENKALHEKRATDMMQTRDAYLSAIEGIKQTVDLILTVVQARKGRR